MHSTCLPTKNKSDGERQHNSTRQSKKAIKYDHRRRRGTGPSWLDEQQEILGGRRSLIALLRRMWSENLLVRRTSNDDKTTCIHELGAVSSSGFCCFFVFEPSTDPFLSSSILSSVQTSVQAKQLTFSSTRERSGSEKKRQPMLISPQKEGSVVPFENCRETDLKLHLMIEMD